MAVWQATNILTGVAEGPKYIESGEVVTIWSVALTTALALNDTIQGPILPVGCFLESVVVDSDDLDNGTQLLFTVGYAGQPAAFISSTSIGQTGGRVGTNVAGALGFTATTNTTLLITITHAAGTPVAGKMRMSLAYTASP